MVQVDKQCCNCYILSISLSDLGVCTCPGLRLKVKKKVLPSQLGEKKKTMRELIGMASPLFKAYEYTSMIFCYFCKGGQL